ncbi:hypothetical protein LOTGIDRAFT_236861 [Lottia gigantea]|uniref:Methyltransferase domain-containing protein n=1 Tax=Lottia gigantea TaxID=225164 RepID=V4B3W2_LOTGI|nr:hypothetical protein LOTGIDRAFT_236861 [Lottia gigantea]ESO83089.1 hypothetical protein LOTGIDRAFT_236861 [Lottia gigantea]
MHPTGNGKENMVFTRYNVCRTWTKLSSLQRTRFLLYFLFACLIYVSVKLYLIESLPAGVDLCQLLSKDIDVEKLPNESWWQYICLFEREMDKPLTYICKETRYVGNWKVCLDERYIPKKPCLVYSFGIAYDFSFDEGMAKYGCEVYSFDPSMGLDDHQHSEGVYFKNLGLSYKDEDGFVPRFDEFVNKPQKWKVRTLKSIMKQLNHEKRVIDVLKFDVEGGEWEVIQNIIQDGMVPQIRQLLTEWHIFPDFPPRKTLKSNLKNIQSLETLGLKRFHSFSFYRVHRNMFFNSQSDACYVNSTL